jgi:uncharacterized membrane protein YfcA
MALGGGAFLAPLLALLTGCSFLQTAGATLLGTLVTSVVGVVAFMWADSQGVRAAPEWTTGLLLGLGGALCAFVGARLQGRVGEVRLRSVLAATVTGLGVFYLASSEGWRPSPCYNRNWRTDGLPELFDASANTCGCLRSHSRPRAS